MMGIYDYDVKLYMKDSETPQYVKLDEEGLKFIREQTEDDTTSNFIEVNCVDSEEVVGIRVRDISMYSYKEAVE